GRPRPAGARPLRAPAPRLPALRAPGGARSGRAAGNPRARRAGRRNSREPHRLRGGRRLPSGLVSLLLLLHRRHGRGPGSDRPILWPPRRAGRPVTLMARPITPVHGAAVDTRTTPIRLLKFVTFFGIGGTEGQVVTMAREIDESRFDLHLACLHCRGEWLEQLGALAGRPLTGYHITNLFNRGALRERLRFTLHLLRPGIQS